MIGQGWLVIGPSLHGSLINNKREISYFQELSLMMISGLIINYGLVLIIHSLKISMIVGGVLAIIGISCYSVMLKRSIHRNRFTPISFVKLFGILLSSSIFIIPIFALPLVDWDARSIWFFHGKMIYMAGALSQNTGWLHPSAFFSHSDYPNLIPTLAAQIAHIFGYWNEYLPKSSLFFLLVPAIILLFTFYRRSFSFLLLIILIPFSFASKLWNGYMDGYITLYFAVSMLLLGRYFIKSKPIDLIGSVLCLFILIYLKNEGELALVAGSLAIVLTLFLKMTKFSFTNFFKSYWRVVLFLVLLLLPFGIWSIYKHQWGITNDLELGTNQSFVQLMTRIKDGSYLIILQNFNTQMKNGLMLLGFLVFGSMALKIKIPKVILPIILAGGIYCVGLFMVYLVTPLDLLWQMRTSVDRTLLTATACIYAASYFLLANLEKNEENNLRQNDILQI
jgi:hypothetical protein